MNRISKKIGKDIHRRKQQGYVKTLRTYSPDRFIKTQ